jgi:predicted transcriptional regulator
MAISLRIPDDIKERASALAEKSDSTPHAFMVDAIREKVEAEEARLAFLDEAETRLSRMKAAGAGIAAADAFAYLEARANGLKVRKPRPRRLP